VSSNEKVIDKTISAFCPQTCKYGDLPFLSFIACKPEPLGIELKVVADCNTGILLWLELHRGKFPMRNAKYSMTHGVTAAVAIRGSEATIPNVEEDDADRSHNPQFFYGDSWFSSVETTIQLWQKQKVNYVGVIKTNHSRFPKKFIEEKMKDWPSGSHLVLEGRAVEGIDLIAIGYKYNSRKVLSFVCNKNHASTELTDYYEACWRDENNNTSVRKIPRPETVGCYFRNSNVVDMHNQARQFELCLEKHWVTQSGYFRFFTTMVGLVVTDAWKAYRHHLHKKHRHKTIEIEAFANLLAKDMLDNRFKSLTSEEEVLYIPSAIELDVDGNVIPDQSTTPFRKERDDERAGPGHHMN